MKEEIEKQIREVLESENSYWSLTKKLFGPDGLFGQLGSTVEERKAIGRSALFLEAQKRVRDMEYEVAGRLRHEMDERPVRAEHTKKQ